MPLPPLYKFLSVTGAKLTLGNNTFRHAKPSDFNDLEDLTVRGVFPEDVEEAAARMIDEFDQVLLRHLNDVPTCAPPLAAQLAQLQHLIRRDPEGFRRVQQQIAAGGLAAIYDVERLRAVSTAVIADLNEFMQSYRVLCVTTHLASEQLWTGYAEGHKGIALRIEANVGKDSKFQAFRPVSYEASRPPLYPSALDMLEGMWFANPEDRRKAALERIIFTKTLEWEHEGEYRLAIPLAQNEEPWDTLRFHPEEVTELYLGLAMTTADKTEILDKATRLNPRLRIFQGARDADGSLIFQPAQ